MDGCIYIGRNVIRLKIGDPFLFGRGGEEILEYRKYGVEPKVSGGTPLVDCTSPLLTTMDG